MFIICLTFYFDPCCSAKLGQAKSLTYDTWSKYPHKKHYLTNWIKIKIIKFIRSENMIEKYITISIRNMNVIYFIIDFFLYLIHLTLTVSNIFFPTVALFEIYVMKNILINFESCVMNIKVVNFLTKIK